MIWLDTYSRVLEVSSEQDTKYIRGRARSRAGSSCCQKEKENQLKKINVTEW